MEMDEQDAETLLAAALRRKPTAFTAGHVALDGGGKTVPAVSGKHTQSQVREQGAADAAEASLTQVVKAGIEGRHHHQPAPSLEVPCRACMLLKILISLSVTRIRQLGAQPLSLVLFAP